MNLGALRMKPCSVDGVTEREEEPEIVLML